MGYPRLSLAGYFFSGFGSDPLTGPAQRLRRMAPLLLFSWTRYERKRRKTESEMVEVYYRAPWERWDTNPWFASSSSSSSSSSGTFMVEAAVCVCVCVGVYEIQLKG